KPTPERDRVPGRTAAQHHRQGVETRAAGAVLGEAGLSPPLPVSLSPEGEGTGQAGAAYSEVVKRLCLSSVSCQAVQPVHQSKIAEDAHSPLSLWGEGPGVRAPTLRLL